MKYLENNVGREEIVASKILSRIKKYSFARPNKYLVSFVLPNKLSTYISAVEPSLTPDRLKFINYNCCRISTPDRRIETSDVMGSSHESRVAIGGEIRPPIQLGFLCYSDMYEKYLFDLWLEFILHHRQRTVMFQCDYSTELVITQLDQKHNPRYETRLLECFPINIAAYNYDAQPSSSPVIIDVAFSFSSFETSTVTKTSVTAP